MLKLNKITYIFLLLFVKGYNMSFIKADKSVKTNEWSMLELHSHPHYEIYFLTSGKRSYFLSNVLYKIQAPALVILPPHTMHKTEGACFVRYNIDFSADYVDEYQQKILDKKSSQILTPDPEQTKILTDISEQILSTLSSDKNGEYKAKILFSYLMLVIEKINKAPLTDTTAISSSVPPLILKVIDYLNDNYFKDITLDHLANHFFVSKPTLIYNFKKYTNCSPIDFLLKVRLTKAKQMLTSTTKTINEIAIACGFSSPNYFGLIFKQKEKLSPLAYRRYDKEKL